MGRVRVRVRRRDVGDNAKQADTVKENKTEVKLFCVVHEFHGRGSKVYGSTDKESVMSCVRKCNFLAKGLYEVVMLGSSDAALEIYSEYSPYEFYEDPLELVRYCDSRTKELRKLAASV